MNELPTAGDLRIIVESYRDSLDRLHAASNAWSGETLTRGIGTILNIQEQLTEYQAKLAIATANRYRRGSSHSGLHNSKGRRI